MEFATWSLNKVAVIRRWLPYTVTTIYRFDHTYCTVQTIFIFTPSPSILAALHLAYVLSSWRCPNCRLCFSFSFPLNSYSSLPHLERSFVASSSATSTSSHLKVFGLTGCCAACICTQLLNAYLVAWHYDDGSHHQPADILTIILLLIYIRSREDSAHTLGVAGFVAPFEVHAVVFAYGAGSMVMATSFSEASGSTLEHVDAFCDSGESENCRLLNTTVDTHDTAMIQSRLSEASASNELLGGKRYTITCLRQV